MGGGEEMKAFINCDELINLIKNNTILTKRTEVPTHWQWFQTSDGVVTWDFALKDRVLVDVEESPLHIASIKAKINMLLEHYMLTSEHELAKEAPNPERLAMLYGKIEASEDILELLRGKE